MIDLRICTIPKFSRFMLFLLAAFACTFSVNALAQQVEFSSSMNPVGSGARATGMGGAFIAVADDATAASWNPAGLIHLEKPEVSLVYSYFNRGQSYNSSTHPELAGTTHETDLNDINYASLAYPFVLLDRNMIVTINYQRLYDMNKSSTINYLWDLRGGDSLNDHINYKQEGYLGAISPAIAIQILPELYFGATVNIWDDIAGTSNWKSSYTSSGTGSLSTFPFNQNLRTTNSFTFSGLNANLGLLYSINGKYSIGFVYKTPFTASVQKETTTSSEQVFPTLPPRFSSSNPPKTTKEQITIDMPASYGVGVAYRHSDKLSFALDVYRTEWSSFVMTNSTGVRTNPVTGSPISQGAPKDTTQIRTGAEYLFIGNKTVIPVRGGFFYDPEPGKGKVDDFFGFSVGSGIAFDSYAFDFSYQYRWGNRVTGDIPQTGINSDIRQHTVMSSLIYHF